MASQSIGSHPYLWMQVKGYEARRLENSLSCCEHHVEQKSDAYCFVHNFDLLSTHDLSFDQVDDNLDNIRLQWACNEFESLEVKHEKV